jgi:EmrB/QacA subfamily drug resistance transporter
MKVKSSTLVLTLFLLGIFMGAIDSGIITPARELIQNSFGVERNTGTWMITLYSLTYAVAMPLVSKMADRYGYKKIYVLGIAVFGLGSLLCGLANFYGTFAFFLAARVIQAVGAGGIMPIANAVIGQSFPEEKRGTALGMVGAVYGVATILGPTLGSSILDAAGKEHWGWVFFINVPISILILLFSTKLANTVSVNRKPMDFIGAVVVTGVILSLMYALTNLDFFNFSESIGNTNVYPYLIIFLVLLPLLIIVESRAKDPVLNLKYFKDRQMLVTMLLALIVGIGMMGMVFVPQFAENVLKIKAGSGGYLVTLLAVFSGFAAPLSGKLLDKKGSRLVLALGFIFNIIGTLILGYIATSNLNFISVLAGLAFMGFGVGFTMGAPLNYLVLKNASENEGATALATMSLIRSIGVAISPSIMIGFIVDASKKLQGNLISVLPGNFTAAMQSGISSSNQAGNSFKALQNADVTTIVDSLKKILETMLPAQVRNTVLSSVENLRSVIENTFQETLNLGYTHMFTAAAIIALLGLLSTFLLSRPDKENIRDVEYAYDQTE